MDSMPHKKQDSHALSGATHAASTRAADGTAALSSTHRSSFAQRIMTLLHSRARQQSLPPGYMHCPFNPEHRIPIAVIVSHMEKVHSDDALALLPDAMYSAETAVRRRRHVYDELYANMLAPKRQQPQDGAHGRCRRRRYRIRPVHEELCVTSSRASSRSRSASSSRQEGGGSDTGSSSSSHSSCSVVLPSLTVPVALRPIDAATVIDTAADGNAIATVMHGAEDELHDAHNSAPSHRCTVDEETTATATATPAAIHYSHRTAPSPVVLSVSNRIEHYWRARCLTLRRSTCCSNTHTSTMGEKRVEAPMRTEATTATVTTTTSATARSVCSCCSCCGASAASDEKNMRQMVWRAIPDMGSELEDMIVCGSRVLLVFTSAAARRVMQTQMIREPTCVPTMSLVLDSNGADESDHDSSHQAGSKS